MIQQTTHTLEEAPRIQEDKNFCSHLLVNMEEGTQNFPPNACEDGFLQYSGEDPTICMAESCEPIL